MNSIDIQNSSLPIAIAGVTKTYGAVTALSDVELSFKSGEFITLLGPSGSGKTTLLMVLAGFIRPDCGSVKFGDEEVILKAPHLRGVGMMFQNYALFPHMSVEANIAYPLKVRGENRDSIKAKVAEVLELVQLGDYGRRRISELSGGQRQRIALARAIVFKPKILLMDEPLSALDKNLRELMQLELRSMHDRLGMTTVLVTHDQREALTMSDRIAVLRDGKVVQVDTSEDLYAAPNSKFVAAFMGELLFSASGMQGLGFLLRRQITQDREHCRPGCLATPCGAQAREIGVRRAGGARPLQLLRRHGREDVVPGRELPWVHQACFR